MPEGSHEFPPSLTLLAELDRLAEETFESAEVAAEWVRKPHPMFEGKSPFECAKSDIGAQRVKDILVTIKHGGVE